MSFAFRFGMLSEERFNHVPKRQGVPLIGLIRRRVLPMCHGAQNLPGSHAGLFRRHLADAPERYAPCRGTPPTARLVLHDVRHAAGCADPHRETNCLGIEDVVIGSGWLQAVDQALCDAGSHL
jgi:hypothetical protein